MVPDDELVDVKLLLALLLELTLDDALPLAEIDDVKCSDALAVGTAHISSGPSARS